MPTIILIAIICFISSLVQGSIGFGFAIIAMSLIPLFLDIPTAVVVVLLAGFAGTIRNSIQLYKYIDFKALVFPLIFVYVGRSFGIIILKEVDTQVLFKALGVLLIILSIYLALFKEKVKIKPTKINGMIAGLSSGLLGGVFNTSGPPLVLYYISSIRDKIKYSATIQATFALGAVYSVILHGIRGSFTMEVLQISMFSIPAVLIGGFIGVKILKKINPKTMQYGIYTLMIVSGVMMLVK